MMSNTGFEFRIKDMFFEPLENFRISLFLIFHPLCYSINLKTYLDGLQKKEQKKGLSQMKNRREGRKDSITNLVKIVIQKDYRMIILSSVEFENTNNFIPS